MTTATRVIVATAVMAEAVVTASHATAATATVAERVFPAIKLSVAGILLTMNFQYSKKQDLLNQKIIINSKNKGLNSKFFENFEKHFGLDYSDKNLLEYIEIFARFHKIDFSRKVDEYKKSWAAKEEEFQFKMGKIFGFRLDLSNFTVYLTNNDRCGYVPNENFFFLTAITISPRRIIAHELFHFYTINKFPFLDNEEKKNYDIKESLTDIINIECFDIIETPDCGYPDHQLMRKFIREQWLNNGDIYVLMNKLELQSFPSQRDH